ncbi:Transmembrane protein 216 [Hondaea fermentalgiana]|uniref:Transmembrane protein 216 n=1 Tax=Hondaea fermentalgiana TaxID=2315210 RepID=A0A2R5G6G2_9STRA|nr:Transmembrane protein 216 [Hondaea fermentalgiana]|eukprot:GBG25378.1 Transmembrane protein 216 [Hondaea fermentalgiana]
MLFFNGTFSLLFVALEAISFIYKGNNFLYPDAVLGMEIFFLIVYLGLEKARIFQASKGNKIEEAGPFVWAFVFSGGIMLIHLFYFQLQTYVLRMDRILNGMGMIFVAIEVVLMIFTSLTFLRSAKM